MDLYFYIIIILSLIIIILFSYILNLLKRQKNTYSDRRININRYCPLCGTKLKEDDCVIGDYVVVDGKKRFIFMVVTIV